MPIKLESGIPIPPRSPAKPKRTPKYPITIMQPGQSFFVKGTPKLTVQRMRTLSYTTRKKHPDFKFIIRAYPNGARVWRVA